MSKLIFFDINGTLVEKDSRTDLPYEYALDIFLNAEKAMNGVNNSARSDKDVFIEVLEKYNKKFTEEKWNSFIEVYTEQFEKFKSSDIWRKNVDAVEFLEKLKNTNHKLSLITGELSIGARYKLQKIGVWKHFKTGGFGEDSQSRLGIAEIALEKAKNKFNNEFDEIFVIGDTILDIKTARHIGAKIISITTGSANTREELLELNPDYIIDNFSEIEHLFI